MSGFVERFREEIELLGGIAKVATKLDVARNTIYNWMAKGNVPLNDLMRLHALGVDIQYVINGEREANRALSIEQERAGYSIEVLNKEEQALLDNYRHSPEAGKKIVEATVAASAQSKMKRKM